MKKIFKYIIIDILRNRMVLFYTFFLFILSSSVLLLEDTSGKGMLSLLNVVLMIVPLFSLLFSTIYLYHVSEFIELLLSQPVRRRSIWSGIFLGLLCSLGIAFLIGCGIPVMLFINVETGHLLILCGLLLTFIFSSMAFWVSVMARDKARGIGLALMAWLYFTVIFDALILFLLYQFADYPVEKYMVFVSMLNPVDLARIWILIHMDVAALMGYTGAVFRDFFGTLNGQWVSFGILLLWIIVPFRFSLKRFERRDM